MSVHHLLEQAARFHLKPHEAKQVLWEVVTAVGQWRNIALTPGVELTAAELDDFAPAFEHSEKQVAKPASDQAALRARLAFVGHVEHLPRDQPPNLLLLWFGPNENSAPA